MCKPLTVKFKISALKYYLMPDMALFQIHRVWLTRFFIMQKKKKILTLGYLRKSENTEREKKRRDWISSPASQPWA